VALLLSKIMSQKRSSEVEDGLVAGEKLNVRNHSCQEIWPVHSSMVFSKHVNCARTACIPVLSDAVRALGKFSGSEIPSSILSAI